jgi:integrase/recombinase XerD
MRSLPVYVTPAEAHAMMAAAENDKERLLIELLWYTGGRISEVLAVRAGDITETGIILPALKSRTRKNKHVILPRFYLERLRERVKDLPAEAYLFPGRRGRMSRVTAWRIVKRCAEKAGVLKTGDWSRGLRPAWPHTLRHGYATALLMQRVPLTLVQRQLGHAEIKNTAVYTQIADPHAVEILEEVKL